VNNTPIQNTALAFFKYSKRHKNSSHFSLPITVTLTKANLKSGQYNGKGHVGTSATKG